MVTMPEYRVEVAWSEQLSGVFRVGISEIGSTSDLLGAGFGANVFDDVTSYVQEVSIQRGRSDDLGPMEQGTCGLVLKDSAGRFNPENPSSDLYGLLVPMRPIRVKAIYDGSTYGLFAGYVERIEHDPSERVTTIDGVDFFEWLQNAQSAATPASTGGLSLLFAGSTGITTVGGAIGAMLDALSFTDPALRDLDTGRSFPAGAFDPDGAASYLEGIGQLLDFDRGAVFVDGNGAVRFVDGTAYWRSESPVADLDGDIASDMKVSVDKQRIVNRQSVTKTGSTEQIATDDTSRRQYGYRDGSPIDSGYLSSDTDALNLAQFIVATNGSPRVPGRELEVKPSSTAALRNQLAREIGDRVTFSEPRGGTDAEGVIEGIRHKIDQAGHWHVTKFLVSKRLASAFTVGVSEVGGTDFLGW